jgi:hypothetical protein
MEQRDDIAQRICVVVTHHVVGSTVVNILAKVSSGPAVLGVGLRALVCWVCWFESTGIIDVCLSCLLV